MPNQRENKQKNHKPRKTKRHGKLNKSDQQRSVRQHPADIRKPTSSYSCMGRRTEDVPLRRVRERKRKNRYYKGVRFCDRIVVVEKVGLYHNWTYIDGIEVYAFNGTRLELVQKRDYDKVHRNEEFIRKELEIMVRNFFEGVLKAQRSCMPQEELEEKAKGIIDGCYKSFLDSDYNTRLTQILPQIEQK